LFLLLEEDPARLDTHDLDRLHKKAFELRTETGRLVKLAGEIAVVTPPEELKDLAGKSIEDLDTERGEISAQLEELGAEKEAALLAAAPKVPDASAQRRAVERAREKRDGL